MNQFGRLFSVQIFGASHGANVGVIVNGVPAGFTLTISDFESDLLRRKGLNQKGTTPRKEDDLPHLDAGIFNNHTTGAPVLITFPNNNTRSEAYAETIAIPRPSHADWVASQKFEGHQDHRGGGTFSARLTTGIVAAGTIAKKTLQHWGYNIQFEAQVTEIGGNSDIEAGLNEAIKVKDTVGAVVSCQIHNVPVGLGEPFWDSVESLLAHAMFAIPAVKGIEFGKGFKVATMYGLEHNDPIIDKDGHTATNHAGGIVGGLTNGENIHFNLAFKPAASTPQVQNSFNFETQEIQAFSVKGRHDLCVALRAPVIVEAMAAIVITDLLKIYLSHP